MQPECCVTDSDRQWGLMLDQPGSAGPATLRHGVGFAAIIIAATIVVVSFRHAQLGAFPQFSTFHAGFVFVVDSIVAFLLFGQFAYHRQSSYAILGAAYLFSALVVIPFLFTFPGAFKAEGVVIGGSQSSIWIWHAWHILFPLIVALSLLAHERAAGRIVAVKRVVPYIGWAAAAAAMLALLVAVAVIVFHDRLPVLITPDRVPLTSTFYVVAGIAAVATASSLALALRAARRRSVLHLWLAVALTAFLGDVVANGTSTGRYTVGWYFGRVESMVAAAILLLVFLGEINRLYHRLGATLTELQGREKEIRRMAYFDPVTDLPNRRLLMDRLNHDLAQANRHGHSTALLFLDMDKFKQVNDEFGHEAGDKLLREVGLRVSRCVRSGDTVSRLAGDEFVIVLPEIAHAHDAQSTAEKVIGVLAEPMTIAGHPLELTTSIGIAIATPDAELSAPELLARADAAMYAAKKAGRNQYCFAG